MRAPDSFDPFHLRNWIKQVQKDRPVISAASRTGLVNPHVRLAVHVELSPPTARWLAEQLAPTGVKAAFCVMVGADFYDATHPATVKVIRDLQAFDHDLCILADPRRYAATGVPLLSGLERDANVLRALGLEPVGVDFNHLPLEEDLPLGPGAPLEVLGLRVLVRAGYTSITDDRGGFTDEACERMETLDRDWLKLTLHPEWWTGMPQAGILNAALGQRGQQLNDALQEWADLGVHPNSTEQAQRDAASGDPRRRKRANEFVRATS